jgi:hypothetical protein
MLILAGSVPLAFEEMGPVLLHAAAFNNSISFRYHFPGLLFPIRVLYMNKFYDRSGFMNYYVAGAMTFYDLPDLIGGTCSQESCTCRIERPDE